MSANFESMSLSKPGVTGMRQTFSPVASPAAIRFCASVSSLENSPANSCPRATRMAPVNVARSTMKRGL